MNKHFDYNSPFDWEEINSCGGFYGDCLEDNGILEETGLDLEFVD